MRLWLVRLNEIASPSLQWGSSIIISRERFGNFWAAHTHDFPEIVLVVRGRGWHLTAAGMHALQPGDLFVLLPGVWHDYRDCCDLEVYNIGFDPALIEREIPDILTESRVEWLLRSGPRQGGGFLHVRITEEPFERACRQAEALFEAGKRIVAMPTGEASICIDGPEACHAHQMQQALLRLFLLEVAVALPWPERRVSDSILVVLQEIATHPKRNWTITEMAALSCLEPDYFARRFRQEVGSPPMEYVMRLKVERAALVLLRSECSIQSIATEFGFTDSSHFLRRFRAVFGIPPRQYQQRYQRPQDETDQVLRSQR